MTDEKYAETTIGAGLDFQWALGTAFSLGLALADTAGDADFPTLPKVTTHKISSIVLDARLWLGSLFGGYHRGSYVFATGEDFKSPALSGAATGEGFSLGIEGEGGWSLVLQTETVRDLRVPDGTLVDVEGIRLRLGFRWR